MLPNKLWFFLTHLYSTYSLRRTPLTEDQKRCSLQSCPFASKGRDRIFVHRPFDHPKCTKIEIQCNAMWLSVYSLSYLSLYQDGVSSWKEDWIIVVPLPTHCSTLTCFYWYLQQETWKYNPPSKGMNWVYLLC